jgi:energy-coupling factor transport system ATP-binding protein
VAIAGILAMEPKVLVLDEPTAGLDPLGTRDMMRLFARLNQMGKTVLLVTHDMEQVYGYCDEVVVISEGRCLTHQKVKEFFRDSSQCEALGILPPALIQARDAFAAAGFKVDESMDTLDKLADAVARQVKHHG